jgi:RNA polymerase sigma-70 factor (ECF subfamily)
MIGAIALPGIGDAGPAEVDQAVEAELPVEAALARRAARGDRDAFARLVDLHQRAVLGLCVRLLGPGEDARDAAQECFVRAWGAMASYDPRQPFAAWALRIARNHCVDLLRRRIPSSRRVELDARRADGERPELVDVDAQAADERLERARLGACVGAAVAALPARYREVIQLFHVEHMSYKDIAGVMDVPVGTVMTWLHRARAMLRAALARAEDPR